MALGVDLSILNQKGTPAFFSDIFANRPAFGFAGRVFISTDTGAIYEDTGTAWTLIADAGAGTTGTLQQVTTNGNTTTQGISITAGGLSANSITNTSLTTGSVAFVGAAGLMTQDNTNFFWDNTTKYLGLGNTGTPSAPLDIHNATANVFMQLNATSTNNSNIAFLNSGVGKWRIGNLYNSGANSFQVYDVLNSTARLTITNTGATTITNTLFGTTSIFEGTGASYGGTIFGVITARQNATDFKGLVLGFDSSTQTGVLISTTNTAPSSMAFYTNSGAGYLLGMTLSSSQALTLNGTLNGTTASFSSTGSASLITALTLNNTGVLVDSNVEIKLSSASNTGGIRLRSIAPGGGNNDFALYTTAGSTLNATPSIYAAGSTGNVLIGTITDAGYKLDVNGNLRVSNLAGTGSRAVLADANGLLSAPVSDISVKENIKPIKYGLNEILKMKPVWFDFIDEYKNYGQGRQNGNIAQDMEQIIPEAVYTTPNTNKMGINYDQLHAIYIKAIQELNDKIEKLQNN